MQPFNPYNLADRAVCHALKMLDEEDARTDLTDTHIFMLRNRHRFVLSLLNKLSLLRGDSNKQ